MISISNIKRACLAALDRQMNVQDGGDEAAGKLLELVQYFQPPEFYLENNRLGFYTGVDKQTGTPCFVLDLGKTRQLVKQLEKRLGCELDGALALMEAGLAHQPPKYDLLQEVNLANEGQYRGVVNGFAKTAKQSKTQAFFEEVRTQLSSATELSAPASKAAIMAMTAAAAGRSGRSGAARPRVRMFVSLDFEWWEKSSDTILEVGWSLWDTVTQRHRTRHWIIRENLNKHNGRYISDNRMNFTFGTSERGSLEKAFDALQAELDALGVSDGLTRQQKDLLDACDIEVALVGHGMAQDQEQAELFEIEWPEGMVTFDTQKLFVGYQLEQMDAEAAAMALKDLMARRKSGAAGPKPTTLELVDQYDDAQEESDEKAYAAPDDTDSDDSDYGLPGAVSNLKLGKGLSSNRPGSGGSGSGSRIAAVQPAKRKAVQGPVRVRPWPAGPLPSEREEKSEEKSEGKKDRLNRQIGLGPMLAELKIKSQRLHNAGNDARFTMEAFLAVTDHTICSDPTVAHNDAMKHDPRYKKQVEASMQAAAEQGWGAPVPVAMPAKHGKAPSGAGSEQGSWNGSASGSACNSPLPTQANGNGATAFNRPASAQGGAWGKPAPAPAAAAPAPTTPAAQGGAQGGAWGKPAPAAAAAGRGGAAWGGRPSLAHQPVPGQQQQQQPQPRQQPQRTYYQSIRDYEPNEDGW